jgi:hypothetical protein
VGRCNEVPTLRFESGLNSRAQGLRRAQIELIVGRCVRLQTAPPWRTGALLRQLRSRTTVEELANECFAARDLKQAGLLRGPWVSVRPWLRWPGIQRMRAARYMVTLAPIRSSRANVSGSPH